MPYDLTRRSPLTGKTHTLELPISKEEYLHCRKIWIGGELIQDAFPMVPADLIEFILSGITPEEWKAAFMIGEDDA